MVHPPACLLGTGSKLARRPIRHFGHQLVVENDNLEIRYTKAKGD